MNNRQPSRVRPRDSATLTHSPRSFSHSTIALSQISAVELEPISKTELIVGLLTVSCVVIF